MAREPSKVKIPKIFQQAESLVDENAKLRKEVDRLRIQNEQLLRELDLREPTSARDRSDSESNSSANQIPSGASGDKLNTDRSHHGGAGDRSSVSVSLHLNMNSYIDYDPQMLIIYLSYYVPIVPFNCQHIQSVCWLEKEERIDAQRATGRNCTIERARQD